VPVVPPRRLCLQAILLVTLLAVASGCQPGVGGPSPTATPTPQQRLESASGQMRSVSAFHFLLTHQNGFSTIANGLDMTRAEGDFVAPGRFKAAIKASFQTLPVSVSVISIQNQTWITNPLQGGEHYLPLPNGPQTTEILDPSKGLLGAASQMRDPRLTGSDKVGGVDAFVIAGSVDAGDLRSIATDAESGRQVPAQIWLGKGDSLVYRVRLSGPLSAGEPQTIVRQLDLSQFNEKVDIQPPPL
jgi:hypothetical protein